MKELLNSTCLGNILGILSFVNWMLFYLSYQKS